MKVLNLFAGIGGNRKLWNDVSLYIDVTAVELDENIAAAYQVRFPTDKVIVADAKEFLLQHYKEFDFIWVSPPCQTHSKLVFFNKNKFSYKSQYPDMSLYQIILFLQLHSDKFLWVVENVKPYYKPLINPTVVLDRHLFWSNFIIPKRFFLKDKKLDNKNISDITDINLSDFSINDKRQVVRNQVDYFIGKFVFECAINKFKNDTFNLFNIA